MQKLNNVDVINALLENAMALTKQSNIYITGIQGSGKSALSNKLGKKYGMVVVHLDYFELDNIPKTSNNFYKNWIRKNFKELVPTMNSGVRADPETAGTLIEKFMDWSKTHTGFVIEGMIPLKSATEIDRNNNRFYVIDSDSKKAAEDSFDRNIAATGFSMINGKKFGVKNRDEYLKEYYRSVAKDNDLDKIKMLDKVQIISKDDFAKL